MNDDFFAIVWVDSNTYYECFSEKEVKEKVGMWSGQSIDVKVLYHTKTFCHGELKKPSDKKEKAFGRCYDIDCSVSSDIFGAPTFGRGTLDDNGNWEFPCRECETLNE